MDLTCIGFGAIFIAAGILFACRILLPRAWKNMSEDEKAKIKIKPLCVNIGVMIMLCGGICLMRGFWPGCSNTVFMLSMLGWFAACIADCVFIAKSGRYKKQ